MNLTLECYDERKEGPLVEIYFNNILSDYKVYLENLDISQFSKLLEPAKKTSILVKVFAMEEMHKAPTNFEEEYSDELKHQRRKTYLASPCSTQVWTNSLMMVLINPLTH